MATSDSLFAEAAANNEDAKILANNALTATDQALSAAGKAVAGLNVNWAILSGDPPDVAVSDARLSVPGYVPAYDYTNDVKQAFDDKFQQLSGDLQPQIQNYLEAFFPDIAQAIKTDSDAWIINTIANGRFVPVEVENAIYQRARDREVMDAQRAEKSVIEAAASRGWTTPPGTLNATVSAIQQDLAIKTQGIDRDISIKAFDVANENTKFAIQQAVGLRTAFLAALSDFIRIAMSQQNQAVDYAKTILAAKDSVYGNAMRLYQAKIEEERLRSTVGFGNLNALQQYNELFVQGRSSMMSAEIEIAKVRAEVATKAATTLGQVAGSAMATRNSMISVSAGV